MNFEGLEEEYELFLWMKKSYPNLLKDSTFDEEFKSAIESIGNQFDDGYIDMHNGCCDELAYFIITKSFKEYVDRHKIA